MTNIYTLIEFENDYGIHNIDLNLIKENKKYEFVSVYSYNTFVKKSSPENELISLTLHFSNNNTIIYKNLNKKHFKYSYYNVTCITTTDKLKIKKLLKISKMKAFL